MLLLQPWGAGAAVEHEGQASVHAAVTAVPRV